MYIKRFPNCIPYQKEVRGVHHGPDKFCGYKEGRKTVTRSEETELLLSSSLKEFLFENSVKDCCEYDITFIGFAYYYSNAIFHLSIQYLIIVIFEGDISDCCLSNEIKGYFLASESIDVVLLFLCPHSSTLNATWCVLFTFKVKFTVKTLYAETWVIHWTTAPSSICLSKSHKPILAPILFLFLSLSIATRCYASVDDNKISQLNNINDNSVRLLASVSPTHNSKTHSSSLVLSRLIQSHFVQKFALPHKISLHRQTTTRRRRELSRRKPNRNSEEDFIPITSKQFPQKSRDVDAGTILGKEPNYSSNANRRKTEDLSHYKSGEISEVVSETGNFSRVISQKLNNSKTDITSARKHISPEGGERPMPPVYGHGYIKSVDKWGIVSIIISSVALTVTLGLITCILSHYRAGAAPEGGGTASDPNNAALTPTSAPMLSVVSAGATAGVSGMERLRGGRAAARDLAAARERQVRLHALRTDLAVNLPPSITMPDGEDHPYSNSRIHIRDAEQEAEIYQKCIRPPPNRTVLESESPPPYRSSSAGLLGSSSSSSSSVDWSTTSGLAGNAPLVIRCHSMSSGTKRPEAGTSGQKTDFLQRTVKIFTGKKSAPQAPSPAPTLPAVVVPSASRRRPPEQQNQPPATVHRSGKGGV